MGFWGPGISSNDTYADIYGVFFDLFNEGLEPRQVAEKLISENQDTIRDIDDCNNFWFALAKALWECKALDDELLERVKTIIASGNDIEAWRRLGADERTIQKRRESLAKFLALLNSQRPKAKSRKKKVIRQPPFEKGACLTFTLENGNYGGAVVLESIHDTEHGLCLVATTRINQPTKPTVVDFKKAEVLVKNWANWDSSPSISWFFRLRFTNVAHLFDVAGTIPVEINYAANQSEYGFAADYEIYVIGDANRQFQFEKENRRPQKKLMVKEFLGKKKWWQW